MRLGRLVLAPFNTTEEIVDLLLYQKTIISSDLQIRCLFYQCILTYEHRLLPNSLARRDSDTMDVTATVLLLSLAVPVLAADSSSSKTRSCADVRQFYSGKGFTLHGVPQSEISGEIRPEDSL